jgi:hypothetical protein
MAEIHPGIVVRHDDTEVPPMARRAAFVADGRESQANRAFSKR